MRHLRHNTSGTFAVGSFIQLDGVSHASGLSIQSGSLYKNGAEESFTPASWLETSNGMYVISASGQNLDTLGNARLHFYDDSTYINVSEDFQVIGQNVYDAWYGNGLQEIDSSIVTDAVWDEVLTGATHNVSSSSGRRLRNLEIAGYQNGAVWIDTVNGTPGTVQAENGLPWNPVDTLADALTIAANAGLKTLEFAPGSSVTLIAALDAFTLTGDGSSVDLGGQDITGCVFNDLTITGIGVDGTSSIVFKNCIMGTSISSCTLPPCQIHNCDIRNDIIANAAGDFYLDRCQSNTPGLTAPSFDFGTAIGSTNLNLSAYSGPIKLESMGDTGTDFASIEGWGEVIEGSCTGGTVTIRGHFTTSGITNLTLSDNARITVNTIENELSSNHGLGSWTSSANPSGSNIVTMATKDSGGDILGGVTVEVRPSGSTTLTGSLVTDMSLGNGIFNLDDGAYDFYAFKPESANWANPKTLSISSHQTVTLNGVLLNIPAPSNPGMSTLYTYVRDLQLNPVEGVEMTVSPSGQQEVGTSALVSRSISSFSDENGLVSLDVAPSTPVYVAIPQYSFEKYLISPASGSLNVTS